MSGGAAQQQPQQQQQNEAGGTAGAAEEAEEEEEEQQQQQQQQHEEEDGGGEFQLVSGRSKKWSSDAFGGDVTIVEAGTGAGNAAALRARCLAIEKRCFAKNEAMDVEREARCRGAVLLCAVVGGSGGSGNGGGGGGGGSSGRSGNSGGGVGGGGGGGRGAATGGAAGKDGGSGAGKDGGGKDGGSEGSGSGVVVGYALLQRSSLVACVAKLVVSPHARRRGVGRALLARAVSAARDGPPRAQACTLHVDEANGAARALYASAGFVATGRRADYYAVGRHAIAMQLELQSDE